MHSTFHVLEKMKFQKDTCTIEIKHIIQVNFVPPVVAVAVPVSFGQNPSGSLGLSFGA